MNIHRLCVALRLLVVIQYNIFILHYAAIAIAENFNLNIECSKHTRKKNVPCVLPPSSLNVVRFLSANQYSDERFLNTKQKPPLRIVYENIFRFSDMYRKCIRILFYINGCSHVYEFLCFFFFSSFILCVTNQGICVE